MEQRELGRRVRLHRAPLAALLAWFACSAQFVPSNVRLSIDSPRRITVAAAGSVISSVTLCPGYQFATLGAGGPTLSPDLHWILVDVKGPYEPASVPVTHALIQVTTGAIVTSPDFPAYAGIPSTLDPIAWASGLRSTLRYKNDTLAALKDPPPRRFPALSCARDASLGPAARAARAERAARTDGLRTAPQARALAPPDPPTAVGLTFGFRGLPRGVEA